MGTSAGASIAIALRLIVTCVNLSLLAMAIGYWLLVMASLIGFDQAASQPTGVLDLIYDPFLRYVDVRLGGVPGLSSSGHRVLLALVQPVDRAPPEMNAARYFSALVGLWHRGSTMFVLGMVVTSVMVSVLSILFRFRPAVLSSARTCR